MSFVHLHTHSEYSLLKASSRIKDLVQIAEAEGMPAIAITDLGNMYGAIELAQAAKKAKIKPIHAFEAYLCEGSRLSRRLPASTHHNILLYARTYEGYENLMQLTSSGWTEGFFAEKPRIDEEIFALHCKDLIAVIPQKKGRIASLMQSNQPDEALRYLQEKKEQLGSDHLYLEIVNHGLAEDREMNQAWRELSRLSGVPLVATNDSYYTTKEDAEAHETLMAIEQKLTLSDPKRPRFVNYEFYFKSVKAMHELFQGYEDALENTLKIASLCHAELKFGGLYLPDFPIPEGYDGDSWLRHICLQKLPEKYKEVTDSLSQRLNFELEVIRKMGFSGYFLVVSDFIQAARDQKIPVGPGRGSAAGSIVAYLTGITNIDPIVYGLYFERFLNPGRVSMPDIDIDFCFRRRNEVIDYVKAKYGSEKVAQIVTFGRLKAKAVIKDVARVQEIAYQEANEISKAVPDDAAEEAKEKKISPLKAAMESQELSNYVNQYPKLFDVALRLEGLARQTGLHAAGVVIAPQKLTRYVPLAGYGDGVATQFDGSVLETQGILKMDFLGLSTLTVIQDCLDFIQNYHGQTIDIDQIPLNDNKVFECLSQAHTAGLFQVDSNLFQGILRKMKPSRFEDIVALVALGRPGPLSSGMVDAYCEGRMDPNRISYPHESLKELLEETYGVILYQEQVMNSAVILAGYSMAGADELRRAMGKKKADEMAKHRQIFIEGASKNGIDTEVSGGIYDLIQRFAEYGFNKAHSAAYGLICYQTAWLKVNYPAEFMAASMSDKLESPEQIAYLAEDCQRMKIGLLSPDVNQSQYLFDVEEGKIRFGLGAVRDVGEKAIEELIRTRQEKPFVSIRDFCQRMDFAFISKKAVENLIKTGAFDSLSGSRSQKLALLEKAIMEGIEARKMQKMGQKSLFSLRKDDLADPIDPRISSSRIEELAWERELTGVYFSGHPLDPYSPMLKRSSLVSTVDLLDVEDGKKVILGGMVSDLERKTNKVGEEYLRFRLSDYVGGIDCIVFPRACKQITFRLDNDSVVVVSGLRKSQSFSGALQIVVEDMESLQHFSQSVRWRARLRLHLNTDNLPEKFAPRFLEWARKYAGPVIPEITVRAMDYEVSLGLPEQIRVSVHPQSVQELDSILHGEGVQLQFLPFEA